ncbi:MAG: Gfo/Idh/MocA family oxidoreductase [Lachnospiraceae bacterium]|nr:Gfo/Idh/MocA family oxidoreductase [Lachnospiraceae bacterium]
MKKVITYGSFDLFHEGHYKLLKRAKELGDYLIVGVTTEQYDEYRGKLNIVDSLMERIEHIKQTGFADQIIIEDHVGQKVEDIQKYKVDIFTVGSDWLGKFEYLRKYCDVVYLERTKGISSTLLRNSAQGIIRLGVIGSGRIARRFIPEVKYVSGVNVEVVYNPHIESAKKLALENELKIYTDDVEQLYKNSDAIYVASPHKTHYVYAKQALERKKHVLCEKPMVFSKKEAEELFTLAEKNDCILIEAIKTAYAPGFLKLISTAKSGSIGKVCDVEACFTKLEQNIQGREFQIEELGGSFTELASYPLLAILKILGHDYESISFVSFVDKTGLDLYTKVFMQYKNAIATAKVGLGVKSEGNLVISGTNGYVLAESPWWLTKNFELRYENFEYNEKFFSKYQGQGLRYEISAFISRINGYHKFDNALTKEDSIKLAEIMEMYLKDKEEKRIKEFVY